MSVAILTWQMHTLNSIQSIEVIVKKITKKRYSS